MATVIDVGVQLAGLPAAELLRQAVLAEDLGFSTVYVPDHLAYEQPGSGLDPGTPAWDPLTMLGALAVATRSIRLGPLVLANPLRHPALVAQAIATVDRLSGGRAVLGLGSGWCRAEFASFGIELPGTLARVRALEEAARLVQQLWAGGRVDHRGEHYRLREGFLGARPVQQPRPTLVIGGSGLATLEVAARQADVVNLVVEFGRRETFAPVELARLSEERFLAKAERVRAGARDAGRPDGVPRLSTMLYVLEVTDDADEAQRVAHAVAAPLGISAAALQRSPVALIGSARECADELARRAREWGLEHVVTGASVRRRNTWERLGREVLPLLREAGGLAARAPT